MEVDITMEENAVRLETDRGIYAFYSMGPDIMRAVYTKRKGVLEDSLLIRKEAFAAGVKMEAADRGETVCLEAGNLRVCFSKATGSCEWERRSDGKLLLREAFKTLTETDVMHYTTDGEKPVVKRVRTVDGERSFIENLKTKKDRTAYRARLGFDWEEGEPVYGLGQGEEGIYNYRGHQQYLYQHNMRIPMPVLVSGKGYAVLADCCSLMTYNEEADGAYLFMDTVEQLDYYLIGGARMDDVIRGIRFLTGDAVMLPKWAFGYVQSKEAYHTAQELLKVGEEYRKRGIPLDCIVQDWNTWIPGLWGEKKVDSSRYGAVEEVNAKLHGMNIHTMVSVWPNMAEGGDNHREFVETGHILSDFSTYDAFDEEARKIYWRQAEEGLFQKGFDSWWCDSTEPFSGLDWGGEVKREPWERYALVGGEHKKYLDPAKVSAFALMHARGIYENQRKSTDKKRVLNLTRSGYISQQRYGAVLWSGDISASWSTFRKQISEGLNMCLCGMPYWTLDVGGFFVVGSAWQKRGCGCDTNPDPLWFWKGEYNDGVKDRGYCELYTRWLEYGAFLPMMRSHGTDTPREIWNFGEPGNLFYDAVESCIRLRYALLPYIYSMAARVTREGYTMLRSLMFDFAGDKEVWNMGNEFMFGDSLLICPVTKPMYYEKENRALSREKRWTCYLPEGTWWYHFWTDRRYEGGQYVTVEAPLGRIPVFVRAGSILPMAQDKAEYAAQKLEKPLLVRVYPGTDAQFTLYDDAGDGYGYENGEFTLTKLVWNDREGKLTVGNREGSWPGMGEAPACQISVVREQK